MNLPSLLACALILPSFASAKDYTVEEKPFQLKTTLDAVFLPTQSTPIRVTPKAWTDFIITSLVHQGATVKKGDTLIGIDTEKLDKYIKEIEKNQKAAALTLAQTKDDLAQLEITTPIQLESAARLEKETAENLKWYTEIGQPKAIAETKHSVSKQEESLSYAKEELKQLLKMYKEDDKVEETEEIILTRTRNSIANAEFALKSLRINAENALNTAIPRKLLSLQLAANNAKIANTEAQEKLPRALEQKRLAVAKAIRDNQKSTEKLTKLKADRAMMNITAPANGIVYYGSIQDGKWNPATAAKVLNIGAKLPAHTTWLTFIPANSPMELSAFAAEANLAALRSKANIKGFATTALNRYQTFPVAITEVASHPETDGSFHVSLNPTLPKGQKIVPGMKAKATVISLNLDKALTVPTGYLKTAADGTFTVSLKLADGKTDARTVTIGASNKDSAVITKGLEKGQVIVK